MSGSQKKHAELNVASEESTDFLHHAQSAIFSVSKLFAPTTDCS
jgi:hypothetical protein